MTRLALAFVGRGLLFTTRCPSTGRNALEITVKVLLHISEFLADQFAAQLRTPVVASGGWCPGGRVPPGSFGWAAITCTPRWWAYRRSASLMDRSLVRLGQLLAGLCVVCPRCGIYTAREQQPHLEELTTISSQ